MVIRRLSVISGEWSNKVISGKNLPVKKSSENRIPFVATYYPKVKDLGKLIKDSISLFYYDEEIGRSG